MAEVVTLGECLMAFVARSAGPLASATTFDRFIAGAEANVAVGLARLGHTAAYLGRVGDDGFGEAIRRGIRGEGVETRFLATDGSATTGVMFRERRTLGAAQVVYLRRGSAGSRLSGDDVERAVDGGLFDGSRWLHLTGITAAISDQAREANVRAADLAHERGLTVSLDINLRRRLWSDDVAGPVLRDLSSRSDVLFGSPDELAVVTGQAAEADPETLVRAALADGPSVVIAKLGANGALLARAEVPDHPIASPAVPLATVVDPVGAGDGFCAGFIAARLEGCDFERALAYANACGASAAAALGDQTGLPDRRELLALLETGATAPDTIR